MCPKPYWCIVVFLLLAFIFEYDFRDSICQSQPNGIPVIGNPHSGLTPFAQGDSEQPTVMRDVGTVIWHPRCLYCLIDGILNM